MVQNQWRKARWGTQIATGDNKLGKVIEIDAIVTLTQSCGHSPWGKTKIAGANSRLEEEGDSLGCFLEV